MYAVYCAACHGLRGEGGIGNTLIGPGRSYCVFRDAQRLYDFVFAAMPQDNPRRARPEEKWDILAFLLAANGELPAGTRLGPRTAAEVVLRCR